MTRSIHSQKADRLASLLLGTRQSADLTQTELAKRLKRPQSFISKYETGERRLDVIEFLEVMKAIGADPHKLIRKLVKR